MAEEILVDFFDLNNIKSAFIAFAGLLIYQIPAGICTFTPHSSLLIPHYSCLKKEAIP